MKYIEHLEQSPEYTKMGKQEMAAVNREGAKLRRNLRGSATCHLPDVIVVIDTMREDNAVAEARRLGIPVVAIVDTNADPELIGYPIAGSTMPFVRSASCCKNSSTRLFQASGEDRVREQVEMAGVSA